MTKIYVESELLFDNSNNIFDNDCYICFEPCNIKSSCGCQEIFIHNDCQKNYITKFNTTKCSICNVNYNNLNYNTLYRKKLTYLCIYSSYHITIISLSLTSSILFVLLYKNNNSYLITSYIFFFIGLIFCINLSIYLYFAYKNNNLICYKNIRSLDNIVIL